jgi:hypothetical protein
MEENIQPEQHTPIVKKKHAHPQVIVVRDWKEYLGESALIVFSVLLALFLTEWFNKMHDEQQTREIVNGIRSELIENKKAAKEQYQYHLQVLRNIDSALHNIAFQNKFVSNGEFNLKLMAPQGVLYRVLGDAAWQSARQHDFSSRVSLNEMKLLTYIYKDQERIMNSEEKIASVFLDRSSRDIANIRVTLILMRDLYRGWAVDRVPGLLKQYQEAIDLLK